MTNTKHKPDCPMHSNWTDEMLVRGLKTCTCGIDKPAPPAPTESCASCAHEHKLCGPPPCSYTPKPAPTEAEVREARRSLACSMGASAHGLFADLVNIRHLRTLLAALDKAQGEAFALSAMHCALARAGDGGYITCALRAENARLVEELARECEDARDIPTIAYMSGAADWKQKCAAQAEQIKRLREVLEFYAADDAQAVEMGLQAHITDRPATDALKEASK